MARNRRPTGDDATVARKRFYRSAERYLKQAQDSSGATAARYRTLARKELDNALNTYSKTRTQKFSQPIQKLANDLGVSLDEERQKIKNRSDEYSEKIRSAAINLKEDSKSEKSLAGYELSNEERRQAEARRILNSPIGSRILGGYVEEWREKATVIDEETGASIVDNSKILPALFDYFEVDNLADMLEKVEQIIGDKLYADEDSDAMYEAIKIMIQIKYESDNAVTQ